jgi:CBS domain containing-hemolysin-like protein
LRSAAELPVLLAGSQLGITVCTLALGAITKPAVHHWLTPAFERAGLPAWSADVAGFLVALLIVTFIHLVVGEMAPKSWAIAHPERSAVMLALPMRGFMFLTRPVLAALNNAANELLRKVGVTPANELDAGQDPAALRHLVEHSADAGTLDDYHRGNLIAALELQALTMGDIVSPNQSPTSVASDARPQQIQETSRATGHLRLLVRRPAGTVYGVVHVRDSLAASARTTAADLMRPALQLDAVTPVYEALRTMRETRSHLSIVTANGELIGLVTLTDLLKRLLPNGAPRQ